MNEIIHQLLGENFKLQYEEDSKLGGPTFSINVIQGGANTNVVPDRCSANIDIRTVPSQDHNQIIGQIEGVIENVKQQYPDLKSEIRILNDQSSMTTSDDDPFVKTVQVAVGSMGGSTKLGGITGYTDSSQFVQADKDFPVVVLGPGVTAQAHQPDEHVDIDKYLECIEIYKAIAKNYLG